MLPRIRTSHLNAGLVRASSARSALRSIASPQTAALRSLTSSSRAIATAFLADRPQIPSSRAIANHVHHQIRRSSHSTQGSYHSPTSANQTLLSDVPAISPRSLVKYLDTYVVGQTKAKKVLAVGVWNHYLRVASNQRMKEEAELRLIEQQLAEEQAAEQATASADQEEPIMPATQSSSNDAAAKEDKEPPLSEALSRSLRLGKYEKRLEALGDASSDKAIQDSWRSHHQIQEQRKAERARDPHGEATRTLMFGRSEREWLVNAGGPSAIFKDDPAAIKSHPEIVPKFGDDLSPPARRVPTKTPAEEASSHLEQRKATTSSEAGAKPEEESALAEAASRMHEAVLSDYTPKTAGGKERPANIGIFGADQPLYFSSNTVRTSRPSEANKIPRSSKSVSKTARDEELDRKWESPQERAAHAAGLVEERTKRALKLARERLSATNASTQSSSLSRDVDSASSPAAAATISTPPEHPHSTASTGTQAPPTHTPSTPSSSAGMNASFISSSPGTLPFFEKSNILLLGPSGSGKTLLLRTLAQALDVPFVHVDATPLTMAGYVGEDVESIIQRLLVQAGWDVNRAQRGIICIDEIDKLRRTGAGGGGGGGNVKDVGGEGVQQALLRMLEGTTIQVADKNGAAAAAAQQAASAGGAGAKIAKTPQEQQGHRLGDVADAEDSGAAGRLGPWYNHRRGRSSVGSTNAALKSLSSMTAQPSQQQTTTFNVDTSSILFVLSGAFVGIEDVIRKRVAPPSPAPPVPASTPNSPPSTAKETNASESNISQTDLLSRLEPVDLEQYGLIPEFIGRVPVSVVLNPLSFDDLVRVMTEPKNSLVDQYTSLFKLNGIDLHISPGAIEEVVHRAMGTCFSPTTATTGVQGERVQGGGGGGARSLRRIMEEVLLDAFYESYGSSSVKYILVDGESVRNREVKLFSRGQRFDYDAQVRTEAEEYARKQARRDASQAENSKDILGDKVKKGKSKEEKGKKKKSSSEEGVKFSPARLKAARLKARAMVRARFRLRNRLSDPVIYI